MNKMLGLMLFISPLTMTAMNQEIAEKRRQKEIDKLTLPAALEVIARPKPTEKRLKILYLLVKTITQNPVSLHMLQNLIERHHCEKTFYDFSEEPLKETATPMTVRFIRGSPSQKNGTKLCQLKSDHDIDKLIWNNLVHYINSVYLPGNLVRFNGQISHLPQKQRKKLTETIDTTIQKLGTLYTRLEEPIESIMESDNDDFLSSARRWYHNYKPGSEGENQFVAKKKKSIENLMAFLRLVPQFPLPHMALPRLPHGNEIGNVLPYIDITVPTEKRMIPGDTRIRFLDDASQQKTVMAEELSLVPQPYHNQKSQKEKGCCIS